MTEQRYAWVLQYDGRGFCGWQAQLSGNSVQQAFELAILQATGCSIRVVGASRTDAGVSAMMQVAHADLPRAYPLGQLVAYAQRFLKPGIALARAVAVPREFHARRSATGKIYEYSVWCRPYPPVFERAWWLGRDLCPVTMERLLQSFVGTHDFTSFQHAQCTKNPVRRIDSISVQSASGVLRITVVGESFVMHQIRSMVGTVVERMIGGRIRGADRSVDEILQMRDGRASGQTAPSVGLLLKRIVYQGYPELKYEQ